MHTPGPWQVKNLKDRAAVFTKTTIAYVYSEVFGDIATQEANGKLVGAAPDLLEASQKAYEAMSARNDPFDMEFWAAAVNGLRAAIAKATE